MIGADDGRGPILSLDIGGTKVGFGWVALASDGTWSIDGRGSIPTNADDGGAAVAQRIAQLVTEQLEAGAEGGAVKGIAVASAGVVDPRSGNIVSATNTMPGWGGTRLGEILREASGLPVHIINDVHAHGLGEAVLGAGRGYHSVLSLAVGTGIGGAQVVDEYILFGEHFLAGHFGHIHHHFAAGMPCSCGRDGHIEAICSGSGITRWYNERSATLGSDRRVKNGRELQDLAEGGDELARTVFAESGYALGEALGSLANCVDPAVVVLSGSMTRSGQTWWSKICEGYAASAMDAVADLELRDGQLGSDAPLLGAALNFVKEKS